MKERRESIVPLPYDWDPGEVSRNIVAEVEKRWNEGWVFIRAEPDRLFESVCIYFEREIR